jgi:hypothetical protein
MPSPYLLHDETASIVARALRSTINLDNANVILLACRTGLAFHMIAAALPQAMAYERARRAAYPQGDTRND